MKITKHDLSFDSIKLDYQALIKTSQVAYRLSLEEISRHYSELRKYPPHNYTSQESYARRLKEAADDLLVVVETYSTLKEGLSRTELEVVNKPEVEEE